VGEATIQELIMGDRMLPAARNPLSEFVSRNIERLRPLIAPGTLDQQQFLSAVVVAANEISKPGDCEPKSVLVAAAHAAMIGLLPGRALGLAFFVPRRLRKSDRQARCNLEIGYQGFINLATRNDYIATVHADFVLKGEPFFRGVKDRLPTIEHEIPSGGRMTTAKEVRDRLHTAYCLWQTCSGAIDYRAIDRCKIDECERSGGPVWKTSYYPEMVLKTAVRHAAKYWRLTRELALAVRLEDQAELGEPQDVGVTIDAEPEQNDVNLDEMEEGE
jgi:phage RecT family recombinase